MPHYSHCKVFANAMDELVNDQGKRKIDLTEHQKNKNDYLKNTEILYYPARGIMKIQ